jgi:hypothetical protein
MFARAVFAPWDRSRQELEETALSWQNSLCNPINWQQIMLSILLKKGDLANPNKLHGIAVGNIAATFISSIIATRLTTEKYLSKFGIHQ